MAARLNTNVKVAFWSLFVGMTLGCLMAISIKYPVKASVISDMTKLCAGENLGLEKLKVGISGKVYYVECRNKKAFHLK